MKEIIIHNTDDKNIITLVENTSVIEKYEEDSQKERIEGNIYLGKVQRVLPGLQAVFIDIGKKKNAFLHIKDIVPKVSNKTGNKEEKFDKIDINKYVKPGMNIIVQVKKDSTLYKGPRVSTHINLPGRYVVIMPETKFVTVSQKVEDKSEIERLKEIVERNVEEDLGVIVRTSAIGKEESEIKKDIQETIAKLKNILCIKSNNSNEPKLLYENNKVIDRLLVDTIDQGIDRIIVNNKKTYEYVWNIVKLFEKDILIEIIEKPLDLYNIKNQIDKLNNRKIWLKCGGFITIDKTEALTAIDVNTGKYIGKGNLNETIYTVNKEATEEIAKQLKLRDIGGIVIIDYIDMDDKSKENILEILNRCIKKDRSKVQVVGFTPLNLLELTRKHMWS